MIVETIRNRWRIKLNEYMIGGNYRLGGRRKEGEAAGCKSVAGKVVQGERGLGDGPGIRGGISRQRWPYFITREGQRGSRVIRYHFYNCRHSTMSNKLR